MFIDFLLKNKIKKWINKENFREKITFWKIKIYKIIIIIIKVQIMKTNKLEKTLIKSYLKIKVIILIKVSRIGLSLGG